MQSILMYYYHIRAFVVVSLIIMLLLKVKILPHAKSLIGISVVILAITLARSLHSETYDYYSFTIKGLVYVSLGVACLGWYGINALLPGWLTWQRILGLMMVPLFIIIVLGVSVLLKVDFYLYNSLPECLEDIEQYQVWIRLLVMTLLWIQFMLMVFWPRMIIKHFKAPLWYDVYSFFSLIYLCVSFLQMFRNSQLVDFCQSMYITIFLAVLCILELFTHVLDPKRIKVTNHIHEDYNQFIQQVDADNMDYLQKNTNLFYKLEEVIMDKRLYENPNLKLEDVAYVSHLTLKETEQAIMTAGYASFNHFIAKCRVVELKELLLKSNGRNILNLYAQVGFANRVSASKYFKLFVGLTPTEWIKQEKKYLYN